MGQVYICRLIGADDSTIEEFVVPAANHMEAMVTATKDRRVRNGMLGVEILLDAKRMAYIPHPKRSF